MSESLWCLKVVIPSIYGEDGTVRVDRVDGKGGYIVPASLGEKLLKQLNEKAQGVSGEPRFTQMEAVVRDLTAHIAPRVPAGLTFAVVLVDPEQVGDAVRVNIAVHGNSGALNRRIPELLAGDARITTMGPSCERTSE